MRSFPSFSSFIDLYWSTTCCHVLPWENNKQLNAHNAEWTARQSSTRVVHRVNCNKTNLIERSAATNTVRAQRCGSCASEPMKLILVVIKYLYQSDAWPAQSSCRTWSSPGSLTDRWDHLDKYDLNNCIQTSFVFLFSLLYKFPQNVPLDRTFSSYHQVVIIRCLYFQTLQMILSRCAI